MTRCFYIMEGNSFKADGNVSEWVPKLKPSYIDPTDNCGDLFPPIYLYTSQLIIILLSRGHANF